MAKRKRRSSGRKATTRKRRRSGAKRRRSTTTVKRLKRHSLYSTNPRRGKRGRRRAGYRRNPAFSPMGIGNRLLDAGKVALGVVVGKGLTNIVSAKIPFGETSLPMRILKRAGVGYALYLATDKFVNRKWADAILVGALIAPVEEVLNQIPTYGPMITGGGGISSYWTPPAIPVAAMGSYYKPVAAMLGAPRGARRAAGNMGANFFPEAAFAVK